VWRWREDGWMTEKCSHSGEGTKWYIIVLTGTKILFCCILVYSTMGCPLQKYIYIKYHFHPPQMGQKIPHQQCTANVKSIWYQQ